MIFYKKYHPAKLAAIGRTGYLVEFEQSKKLFEDPKHQHTKEYLRGEFS
jgi:ABC-type phosphate transport system ATPase subunit